MKFPKIEDSGPQSSSSFTYTGRSFNIAYGKGQVVGTVVDDNVQIADLSLTNYTFGVANQETPNFSLEWSSFDGLVGLAKSVCIYLPPYFMIRKD